jgi:hypothetical protein
MPLFGGVHGPTFPNSFLLYAVARNGVPCQLEPDEIRHHPAAREVTPSVIVVADQVVEPAHGASLHGHGRGTNRIGPDVLVECRADKIGNDPYRTRRWSDQSHVPRMPDIRAVRKKLLFQFFQNLLWGARLLRQWLVEKASEFTWFHVGKHWLFFDVLQVLGQQVDHSVPNLAKFSGIHEST